MNKEIDTWKFDSDATKIIKGVAIILMVCNHLFPIPEWIYPENAYIGLTIGTKTLEAYIGGFSKICVAIFAFLTGYGMYFTYKNKNIKKAYRHTLKKLVHFLTTYWIIILIIYIPIMKLCNIFNFSLKEFMLNLVGYKVTYIRIAWYVRFYIELIITFPIYIILLSFLKKKSKKYVLLIFIFIINIILNYVNLQNNFLKFFIEYFQYIAIVLNGYIFAENKIFENINKRIHTTNICVYVIIELVIFILRGKFNYLKGINLDVIYTPIFIYFILKLLEGIDLNFVKVILKILGKYSLEIWFLHAIFFIGNPTIQKIAYWPKISIFILIWVFIVLIPIAKLIQTIVNEIFSKR